MAVLKVAFLSLLAAGVAVFFGLDYFEPQREGLMKFINTCPLHWFNKFSKDGQESEQDGVYNVIAGANDRLFSKEELAEYHGGEGSKGLYLGILGRVYDVQRGEKFYGEGGGYSFFRAIDGTLAYMTGDFNEKGLVDTIEGLSLGQMIELEDWINFYDKSYTYMGKLVGNFYDSEGKPTPLLHEAVSLMKQAHQEKNQRNEEKQKFPPCNSSWKQGSGKRFWCSTQSGGVKRDWVGVPRQYFTPGEDGGKCVCVRTEGPPDDAPAGSTSNHGNLDNPNLREYENCDSTASECYFPEDK